MTPEYSRVVTAAGMAAEATTEQLLLEQQAMQEAWSNEIREGMRQHKELAEKVRLLIEGSSMSAEEYKRKQASLLAEFEKAKSRMALNSGGRRSPGRRRMRPFR